MTLAEAIRAAGPKGKIRRRTEHETRWDDETGWYQTDCRGFGYEDVIADNWEAKPKRRVMEVYFGSDDELIAYTLKPGPGACLRYVGKPRELDVFHGGRVVRFVEEPGPLPYGGTREIGKPEVLEPIEYPGSDW